MSIRHYSSSFDDLDEATVGLLASRYCKVASKEQRQPILRHHRGDGRDDNRAMRKPRRPRVTRDEGYAE